MDNIFVYFINLPPGVDELITPCLEGYTVYIDKTLDDVHRMRAYNHAVEHILQNDFERTDVQQIESDAHENAL